MLTKPSDLSWQHVSEVMQSMLIAIGSMTLTEGLEGVLEKFLEKFQRVNIISAPADTCNVVF